MRWERKPEPTKGDSRTVRRFAWLPEHVGSVTVWLESFNVDQEFVCAWHHPHGPSSVACGEGVLANCEVRWVTTKRRLMVDLPEAKALRGEP